MEEPRIPLVTKCKNCPCKNPEMAGKDGKYWREFEIQSRCALTGALLTDLERLGDDCPLPKLSEFRPPTELTGLEPTALPMVVVKDKDAQEFSGR